MLSQFSRHFFLWVIFQIAQPVSSFQCYVCAPDEGKPEDMYTLRKSFPSHHLQPCSKYKPSNKHQYLLDCPTTGSNGCLTKFEANGSVMRSCAPIAIEDCKEANGVNYCYCKKEGCNTPERKLSDPHKPDLGHAQAAARMSSDQSFGRYFDDEDLSEGSGQWGDFYYDDYNYGLGSTEDAARPPDRDTDDTEYGEGAHDDSDLTEPPPYLDLEEPRPTHKYDRSRVPGSSNNDLAIIADRAKPSSGASPLLSPLWSLLMLILMSEALART